MPNMDGTGPEGRGPLTGRGLGKCRDDNKDAPSPRFRRGSRPRRLGLGRRVRE